VERERDGRELEKQVEKKKKKKINKEE